MKELDRNDKTQEFRKHSFTRGLRNQMKGILEYIKERNFISV